MWHLDHLQIPQKLREAFENNIREKHTAIRIKDINLCRITKYVWFQAQVTTSQSQGSQDKVVFYQTQTERKD